jgi:hypothetical protein
MYTKSVIGYGVRSSTAEFMVAKSKFYKWAEGFTQTIVSDFTIRKYKDGKIICEFIKQSTFKGKTKDYPSYLIFEKHEGAYLISAEGDALADAFNGYKLRLGEVKSVDVVSLTNIRTTSNTVWFIASIVLLLILSFLVYYFRKNHLRTKQELQNYSQTGIVQPNTPPLVNQRSQTAEEIQKEKGDDFEKFILRSFDPKRFTPIDWTSDKGLDGRYPTSNQNPDLIMELKTYEGSFHFAVECKWRANFLSTHETEICSSNQLNKYKTYGHKNKMEVFLAYGLGGLPSKPEKLYIIPLREVAHHFIKIHMLAKYEKESGKMFYYDIHKKALS